MSDSPEPKRGLQGFDAKFRLARRQGGDLRTTLLAGFAFVAIVPMIVGVGAIVRIAEDGIGGSTSDLARISRETMGETSDTIVALSRGQIEKNGQALTDIGSRAVRDTTSALMSESERRFQAANEELIAQFTRSDEALTRKLVEQSQVSTRELARQLILASRDSNRELTAETAKLAEDAIIALAERMVAQAQRNTNAISSHIVNQNKEAAKRLGERMLTDIEREPVVNFKNLASIFARGIATNKVAPITDGYLAVVDMRGLVLASTRYRKGQQLTHLGIVKQALGGQASEDSLIRFYDGKDVYLGVFARREDGGAVVFAYLADRARVDTERMKADLQRTLTTMGDAASGYVVQQLNSDRAAMRQTASQLTQSAVTRLKATSQSLSERTAQRMQGQADAVSSQAVSEMTEQARTTASEAASDIRTRSEAIASAALAAMRPIGTTFATQAETAMREQAAKAVAETGQIMPQAADEASQKAAARMGPEAQRLAEAAKQKMWSIALALVGMEILLAILAALLLSGRIAAPILTAQQKAREEQERLSREMEIASKIQTSLLPPLPAIPAYDLAVSMTPAEEVGGDFVELLPGADGTFWVGIGDVTGHGLTPGLIMMMAQSTFNAFSRAEGASPKQVYDGMNAVLHQNIKDRLKTSDHMTLSILRHDGDGSFVHCGAHLDVLIHRAATGDVERLVTEGPWIGLLPECSAFTTETRFTLAPGDTMLLYTDGLIEVANAAKEQWDMDRLVAAFGRVAHLEAAEIQSRLLYESLAWADRVLDDISMVVVKRQPVEATTVVPQAQARPALERA